MLPFSQFGGGGVTNEGQREQIKRWNETPPH